MARLKPEKVVYVPPEATERLTGEYRVVEKQADDDGPAVFGGLAQWVDEVPQDPTDGTGHFATFDGDDADYTPIRS